MVGNAVAGAHFSPPKRHDGRYLGLWEYPQGGNAFKDIKTLSRAKNDYIVGVTLSVAPGR
jgi:hypothetical protein